jgi:hypothetical protein
MLAVCSVEQMSDLEDKAHDNFLSNGVGFVQSDWIDTEMNAVARELWQAGQHFDRIPLSRRFTAAEVELSHRELFNMAQEVLTSRAL